MSSSIDYFGLQPLTQSTNNQIINIFHMRHSQLVDNALSRSKSNPLFKTPLIKGTPENSESNVNRRAFTPKNLGQIRPTLVKTKSQDQILQQRPMQKYQIQASLNMATRARVATDPSFDVTPKLDKYRPATPNTSRNGPNVKFFKSSKDMLSKFINQQGTTVERQQNQKVNKDAELGNKYLVQTKRQVTNKNESIQQHESNSVHEGQYNSSSKNASSSNNVKRQGTSIPISREAVIQNLIIQAQQHQKQFQNENSQSSQLLKKIYQDQTSPGNQSKSKIYSISSSILQNHQNQLMKYQKFVMQQQSNSQVSANNLSTKEDLQSNIDKSSRGTQLKEKNQSKLVPANLILDQFVTKVAQGQDGFNSPKIASKLNTVAPSKPSSERRLDEKQSPIGNKQQPLVEQGQEENRQKTYYVRSLVDSLTNTRLNPQIAQIFRDHLQQSFTALNFCQMLKPVDQNMIELKRVNIKRNDRYPAGTKTIVFDLDETLIHCNENNQIKADVYIPIIFPTGDTIQAGINIRPFCFEILKELSQLCEVIVFTASHQCYASRVVQHLDPKREYISATLFRDSCVVTEEGVHIKDLRVINRDQKDMPIALGTNYLYERYQIENGIPIIPYYDNKNDTELRDLLRFLKKDILPSKDVREVIQKTFQFRRLNEFLTPQTAAEKLFILKSS